MAADYYQAMNRIESRMALPEDRLSEPPAIGQLLALADSISSGMLSPAQSATLRSLCSGLHAWQDWFQTHMEVVKVRI